MYLAVTVLLMKLTVSMTVVGRTEGRNVFEPPPRPIENLICEPPEVCEVGRPEGREVFDPQPINTYCEPPEICARLNFYAADGKKLLGSVFGTNKKMKVKSVAKVQQTGTGGSYTFFKRPNHKYIEHRHLEFC